MADNMCWKTVCEVSTKSGFCGFLKALEIWIERPHVVNRRLMGALILKEVFMSAAESLDLASLILHEKLCLVTDAGCEPSIVQRRGLDLLKASRETVEDEKKTSLVILRKLLPRQLDREDPMFELVVVENVFLTNRRRLDREQKGVIFVPLEATATEFKDLCYYIGKLPDFNFKLNSYRLLFENGVGEASARVVLQIVDVTGTDGGTSQQCKCIRDGIFCPTVQWLQDRLIPKLCKWAEEIEIDGKSGKGSLRLVPLDEYTLLYRRLKQDYGERFVKIWPERTDPHKFVYEDVAIAAYLLVLWKEERIEKDVKEKQSFVDLGCGNGLLVHILSQEGHPGRGIDVRRRNIWDLYGGNTKLEERALDPTISELFPDVDWLIGNHSDELTPWVPVMAARSSYSTRYFVLPCCLFDFNCKFVRKNNKVAQYRGYLDFVQEVGETCGFQVEEDSLRIPSTKRICHVGRKRTYRREDQTTRESLIKNMIQERGCDIDNGRIPQTLIPVTLRETRESPRGNVHTGTSLQPVEEFHKSRSGGFKASDHPEQDFPCKNQKKSKLREGILRQGPQFDNDVATEDNNKLCVGKDSDTQPPVSICSVHMDVSNHKSSCFQPRPTKQPVRNCAALEKSLKEFIVNTVARKLLGLPLVGDSDANMAATVSRTDSQVTTGSGFCTSNWRRGGSLELCEVAKLFDQQTLSQLKHECGGLQTVLRNHYYVFKVVGGVVKMRDWTQESPGPRLKKGDTVRRERRAHALWKTSMCWFYVHHPDGCPVPGDKCPFAHSNGELRERPSLEYLNNL